MGLGSNLKEVAQRANVSVGTASKVINHIYVSPELRIRVEKAMQELNYTPNSIARSLKKLSTKTIGVIIPDISSPITSKIVLGIEKVGRQHGYSIMLCNTDIDRKNELDAIRLFKEKMVTGIIYTGNTVSPEVAESLKQSGIATVFVSTGYPDKFFTSVNIDNQKAAFTGVDLLCRKGHRRIAMLSGPLDDPNAGTPRLQGYMEALRSHDIPIDESLIRYGNYRTNDGYDRMMDLLAQHTDFTAVFCASDDMAIGAMKALNEKGLCVARDVSVMGFDGVEMIQYTTPSLASVIQPLFQFGLEAAKILLNKIEGGHTVSDLVLDFEIAENQSIRDIG